MRLKVSWVPVIESTLFGWYEIRKACIKEGKNRNVTEVDWVLPFLGKEKGCNKLYRYSGHCAVNI